MTLMTGWVYFWNAARSLIVNQAISFYIRTRVLTNFEEKKIKGREEGCRLTVGSFSVP